jgi:adenylate cyclase
MQGGCNWSSQSLIERGCDGQDGSGLEAFGSAGMARRSIVVHALGSDGRKEAIARAYARLVKELRVRWSLGRLPGWLLPLARIGVLPGDSEELRLRKEVLVLSSTLMASLAFAWVVTYGVLGLWVSAAIPLAYQLASAASIYRFARTRGYLLFRSSQLWMSLALPFALQWSLGGFRSSSAVCLWAFTSPLGALLFVGARQAIGWFLAFVALVAVSGASDPALSSGAPHVPGGVVVAFFALNIVGVATTAYVLLQYFVREREREHARSERLLLNVLPEPVAAQLKRRDGIIADACPHVTVLFADIVGFTPLSERLPAAELVALLDRVFARWDQLAAAHGVEKIKTIGDAYMVAAGIPLPREDHAEAIAELALQMGPELERLAADGEVELRVRIGIDSGPVVAGVIGRAKFIYDLWGDPVNTASRMESHAEPGTIQVTERAYELLRGRYELRPRGTIEVKGKGPMSPYLLLGRGGDCFQGPPSP